jgi:hypothetical protein
MSVYEETGPKEDVDNDEQQEGGNADEGGRGIAGFV